MITFIVNLWISKRLPQIFASSFRVLLGVILWLATIRTPGVENRKWGFWRRLLVLGHFCGAPRFFMHYRKSKDYDFTNDYI